MAKYHNDSLPVITDQIIQIVKDGVGFANSEFCQEQFKHSDVNPKMWKWVKIQSHRRSGYSTAALKLLQTYTSALIITHSYPSANRLRQVAIEENLVPRMVGVFHDNIAIQDHIVPEGRMDNNWFASHEPYHRYQLIIIDPASMVEQQRGLEAMDEFRYRLFNICDLLVELS